MKRRRRFTLPVEGTPSWGEVGQLVHWLCQSSSPGALRMRAETRADLVRTAARIAEWIDMLDAVTPMPAQGEDVEATVVTPTLCSWRLSLTSARHSAVSWAECTLPAGHAHAHRGPVGWQPRMTL